MLEYLLVQVSNNVKLYNIYLQQIITAFSIARMKNLLFKFKYYNYTNEYSVFLEMKQETLSCPHKTVIKRTETNEHGRYKIVPSYELLRGYSPLKIFLKMVTAVRCILMRRTKCTGMFIQRK